MLKIKYYFSVLILLMGLNLISSKKLIAQEVSINWEEELLHNISNGNTTIFYEGGNHQKTLGNYAEIYQEGINNTINYLQAGKENKAIIRQKGNNNVFNQELQGDENTTSISQNGNNNSIKLGETISNNQEYKFLQRGNKHTVEVQITGKNSGIEVEQKGPEGMEVKIYHKGG